jgi:hypothetical protein
MWCAQNSVVLKPHSTQTNKTDQDFGVETIKNHYRFGRVRLPGSQAGREMAAPLIKELTAYPNSVTTDCIMANWFMEFQLQYLVAEFEELPSLYNDIPEWMNRATTYA